MSLPDALRARGAEVDVLALYETVAEAPAPRAARAGRNADYLTFTSSSTVRFFAGSRRRPEADLATDAARLDRPRDERRPCASAGLEPHVEAERHDIDGAPRGAARGRGRARARGRVSGPAPARDVPVRLRARQRVRRRLPCGDRPRCPQARVIDLTHAIPRHECTRAPSSCAEHCPTCPRRSSSRSSTRASARPARAADARSRCERPK